MAARMPMIATTIISSIRVKPCWTFFMLSPWEILKGLLRHTCVCGLIYATGVPTRSAARHLVPLRERRCMVVFLPFPSAGCDVHWARPGCRRKSRFNRWKRSAPRGRPDAKSDGIGQEACRSGLVAGDLALVHVIDLLRVEEFARVAQVHLLAHEHVEKIGVDVSALLHAPEDAERFGERLARLVRPVLRG